MSFRFRCLRKGDLLDERLRDPDSILALEVMQFLYPVTACINRLWFQMTMLSFGIWLISDAYTTSDFFATYGNSRCSSLRLEMHLNGNELMGNNSKISQDTFLEFTALRDGCSISALNFSFPQDSQFPLVAETALAPIELNGFALRLSDPLHTIFSRQSARILVKGSHESMGADWYLLGQSTAMRKVCSGV
jgi:hypothetical protein